MQIFLVGGAVRDKLLGLPVHERDWVVVGSTEEKMLESGYIKVGKDFPVFLHPETQEEYALARTERKTGKGYYGFSCYAAPDVTLEQDLQRRDLTINAMAESIDEAIIDPYGGQRDLEQRLLRHVSPAFSEDPVRILRVARFAARFVLLGFHVAPETIKLMQQMVEQGEADELVAERVWQEWQLSLSAVRPAEFLQVLYDCGALKRLFPPLAEKFSEVITNLTTATANTPDPIIRFAATLCKLDPTQIKQLCSQYRVPHDYQDLALLINQFYSKVIRADSLSATDLLQLLTDLDAWRRPLRFEQVLEGCLALNPDANHAVMHLKQSYVLTDGITTAEFVQQGLQGAQIKIALQEKRLEALQGFITN